MQALLEENLKQKELREKRARDKEEKERRNREALQQKKEHLMKTKGFVFAEVSATKHVMSVNRF